MYFRVAYLCVVKNRYICIILHRSTLVCTHQISQENSESIRTKKGIRIFAFDCITSTKNKLKPI